MAQNQINKISKINKKERHSPARRNLLFLWVSDHICVVGQVLMVYRVFPLKDFSSIHRNTFTHILTQSHTDTLIFSCTFTFMHTYEYTQTHTLTHTHTALKESVLEWSLIAPSSSLSPISLTPCCLCQPACPRPPLSTVSTFVKLSDLCSKFY